MPPMKSAHNDLIESVRLRGGVVSCVVREIPQRVAMLIEFPLIDAELWYRGPMDQVSLEKQTSDIALLDLWIRYVLRRVEKISDEIQ